MTTITKERLLTIKQWRETYGPGSNVVLPAEEAEELARIALTSLEAEPVAVNDDMAYAFHHALSDSSPGADEVEEIKAGLRAAFANVTTQPAPVVPEFETWFNSQESGRSICSTQIRRSLQEISWNACRAAMLHGAEPVSQTYKLNELSGNSPVTPDSWISCSERMPDTKTAVLVAKEFDRKGDWRMKWATYIPGHPDANDGWVVPGASWIPSHWMPLPEPPL
ncbi:TPA: DUF551 domain-containing protein [Escherichia coli]